MKNLGQNLVAMLIVAGLAWVTWMGSAEAKNPQPGGTVVPASPQLVGQWWQWAVGQPAAVNPVLDETGANCARGQSGPVWFLGGTFVSSAITRTCMVPGGKQLLIPPLTTLYGAGVGDCGRTGSGPCDVPTLRAKAAAQEAVPQLLQATIDGNPVLNLSSYRVQSLVFPITLPQQAIFGLTPGTYAPHVSDGYWLLIGPLPAGPHTIHVKGIDANGFSADVTQNITMLP